MKSRHQAIRTLAVGFGMCVAAALLCAMAFGLSLAISFIPGSARGVAASDAPDYAKTFSDVTALGLSVEAGRIEIVPGDTFSVTAYHAPRGFTCALSDGRLKIKSEFDLSDRINALLRAEGAFATVITVTVPEQTQLSDFTYEGGAGLLTARGLSARHVSIDGGVGAMRFEECAFDGANFDTGVGQLVFSGVLTGRNVVSCGIGQVEFTLRGAAHAYALDVSTGIGTVTIDGERVRDDTRRNTNAPHRLEIDCGIGAFALSFEE